MTHAWTIETCYFEHKCDTCKDWANRKTSRTCFACGEWADTGPNKQIERNCHWEPKENEIKDEETAPTF
jgi:hypothetical protein